MNKLSRLKYLWRYYKGAKTIYNIHSPFLYDFVRIVFDTQKNYYSFYQIELVRQRLLKDSTEIKINDLGAGTVSNSNLRSIKEIASTSSSGEKKCRVLHNIANYFHAKNILELGTNLGLGTAYIFSASKEAEFHSVEGDENLHRIAEEGLKNLGIYKVKLFNQAFEKYFRSQPKFVDEVELCFVDGNHTKDATLEVFHKIWNNAQERKCIIFDDIYWSDGMAEAWAEIKAKVSSGFTVDVYQMGIVIIDPKYKKVEHIKYIPLKYKPLSLGIFG